MRRALLVITGIETLVWLYLVVGGLNDALFFAKGYGREAAQLANMVFMLFVLPAGILAIANRLCPPRPCSRAWPDWPMRSIRFCGSWR